MRIVLPKFEFVSEYSDNLISMLQDAGMVKSFQGCCATFTEIIAGGNVYIGDIIHKTVIEVNEKGTTAAAATIIRFSVTSVNINPPPPKLFRADHPFRFYIYDGAKNLILFQGQVVDPTSNTLTRTTDADHGAE
eukprot:UN11899